MARTLIFACCLGASLMVCTSVQAERAGGVSGAFAQPFRDLGVLRQRPEDVLRQAAAAPYAAPSAAPGDQFYCTAITSEITSLDVALGSDVDVRTERHTGVGSLASGAISNAVGDVIGLPYRGVIRRLSGAERRDRDMQSAIQAGMVRRAFLKGLRMRDCSNPQAPASQTLAASDSTPLQAVSPNAPVLMRAATPAEAPSVHVTDVSAVASAPSGGTLQPVSAVAPAG